MVIEVTDISLRQNIGHLLDQVEHSSDSILINKDGKPVAALVDAELFARIHRMRLRFDNLTNRIAEAYAQTPVEIGLAEIDAAVEAERAH